MRFFYKINQIILVTSYDDVLTLIEATSEHRKEELNERHS